MIITDDMPNAVPVFRHMYRRCDEQSKWPHRSRRVLSAGDCVCVGILKNCTFADHATCRYFPDFCVSASKF